METSDFSFFEDAIKNLCYEMDISSDAFVSYARKYITYSNVYQVSSEFSGNSKICYISYNPNPMKIILFKLTNNKFEYGEAFFDLIKHIFKDYVDFKLSIY